MGKENMKSNKITSKSQFTVVSPTGYSRRQNKDETNDHVLIKGYKTDQAIFFFLKNRIFLFLNR